jgi:hypothetical protein
MLPVIRMYEHDIDLDSALLGTIDGFRDERDQFWREDEEGRRALRFADWLADLLHGASDQLLPPDDDWNPELWSSTREFVDDPDFLPLVRERLQITIALKMAPRSAEMADRCLDATRALIVAKPGTRVLKYVRRLTSCYIAGFFPECVVLARAVVERALKDTFERTRKPLPAVERGQSALKALIDEAQRSGWLSEEAGAAADQIRHRGNKAVHDDPELVADVRDTVHGAILVIRQLASVR